MTKLIYEDLSYKLIGLAYEVDDIVGYGQSEKVYSDSFEELLKREKIVYEKEYYAPIIVNNKVIAKRYYDFLINGIIILELKTKDSKYREVCTQVFKYLKASGLKLGLIIRFTKNGIKIKRIPNIR